MKIIITEEQYRLITEGLSSDNEFRNLIKSYESTVTNSKGQHYAFDDMDPKQTKTFVKTTKTPYGGTLTIGWGHTGEYAKPGNVISNSAAEKLLTADIQKHEDIAKKIFPKYSTYPLYVQRALVNSVFRGEAKSNYKWVQNINAGNWSLGAKQYLEGWDIDFSTVGNPKYRGTVAERMKKNQNAFIKYANELKTTKQPTAKTSIISKQPTQTQTKTNTTKYPFGNMHIVKPNDSIFSIISKYNNEIDLEELVKLNNLKSLNVQPGQILKLK